MSILIRTGISLDSELLLRFDRVIRKKGYKNRSEAIRDLVRDYAVTEDVEENRDGGWNPDAGLRPPSSQALRAVASKHSTMRMPRCWLPRMSTWTTTIAWKSSS